MKRLSKRLDLPAALGELDITVTDVDDEEVHGLCPQQVREGDVPSRSHWSIAITTGKHHCFSCGYGGTFPTLVCEQLGLWLRTRGPKGERLPDTGSGEAWIRERGMDLGAVRELGEWDRPAVLEDIQPDMGEHRLAAFSDPPLDAIKARRLNREAVEQHGVRWDVAKEAWILPVRCPVTEILWGWQLKGQGSRLFRNHPRGVRKSQTLFGLDAARDATEAVLVESPLDAVRLTGLGLHGVASFGAVVSGRQCQLLEARFERVVVAMDNPAVDDAGRKSSHELYTALSRRVDLRFADYGDGGVKDIGDMKRDDDVLAAVAGARHAWRGRRAIGA